MEGKLFKCGLLFAGVVFCVLLAMGCHAFMWAAYRTFRHLILAGFFIIVGAVIIFWPWTFKNKKE